MNGKKAHTQKQQQNGKMTNIKILEPFRAIKTKPSIKVCNELFQKK